MNCQFVIESDIVIYQILSSVNLPMHESAILLMVDILNLLPVGCACFFHEHRYKAIKANFHFPKKNPQTASIIEHIICITEHHIVSGRMVKAGIPCSRYPSMRFFVVFDNVRIIGQEFFGQKYIRTIVADDYPDFGKINVLLNGDAIKQRLDNIVRSNT